MLLEHERNYGSGHGGSHDRMLLVHERFCGLSMDAIMSICSWNTNGFQCLGMDALMTIRSWKKNVMKVWAWMLW